jgi:hypothetical protein
MHPAKLLESLPPELPASVGLVGTEAEARKRASDYFDAGLDELVLVPATAGDDAGKRTLSSLRDLDA